MKEKIIFNAPLNRLSIGQTSRGFLKALFKRNDVEVAFHPLAEIDLANFPHNEDFNKKLQEAIDGRFNICAEDHTLKLWHINGGENRVTRKQHLFTFHETNAVTTIERNILNLQDSVMTSSSESIKNFSRAGVTAKLVSIPLGFDEDIKKNNKDYRFGKVIHWGLMGKIEKRKNTVQILQSWAKLYGGNSNHQLSCAIANQFMKPEQFQELIGRIFNGKVPSNINFLPYLNNVQVIDYLNSIDIELSGLSNAEGWNIPAFNATCLGKWVPVTNVTAHRDWAIKENSLLIEPDGMQECYDGQFFHKGSPFNQGHIYYFSPETIEKAMKEIEVRAKTPNPAGEETGHRLTYDNTIDLILKTILA